MTTNTDKTEPTKRQANCRTCRSWLPDELKGAAIVGVWGYCTHGFEPGVIIPSRLTTDLTTCSAHREKDASA